MISNNKKSGMTRRSFLKTTAGSGLALGGSSLALDAAATTNDALPFSISRLLKPANLPKQKGSRVVVVGGGWSGLSIAKYLKFNNSDFDVVLIDRRPEFISFPVSNSWLADQVSLDFLTHSYFDAATNNGYVFFNASMLGMDRESRKVYTDAGYVDYEYLVLAPGIEYDYPKIGIDDPDTQFEIFSKYPGGFYNSSELVTIKRKLHEFKGGTFVMNVPSGEYRCTAAPYERACMAAALFRKHRVPARILLLDMNADIRIKKDGFVRAFEDVYSDYIEYLPSSEINSIEAAEKTIGTDFDTYDFDDAIIYPPVRASSLLEESGIANPVSPQKTANTDPFKYHLIGDEHVYITGDSRSQPFSKGGHTAHSEAQYVAEVITAHEKGQDVPWRSPQTMCFSAVDIDPLRAMSIITFYKFNKISKEFEFDRTHMIEEWDSEGGQASIAWAEGMFRDMFY